MSSAVHDTYNDSDHSEPDSSDSDVGPNVDSSDAELDLGPEHAASDPPPQAMGPGAQAILHILYIMDSQGVSLADLLHAISWGDPDCTQNAKCCIERTRLLNSPLLPGILRHWWKPPRQRNSKDAKTSQDEAKNKPNIYLRNLTLTNSYSFPWLLFLGNHHS
ncbi:hypothetical protein C8R43DRAFT_944966 [Mycena crocata]|nr:hypothetical protein C8R43DRAFT_944966 [Mycena crocata]